ncbi:MAG: YraN family protein [Prevotellaceae bacterium]|jgi:putative endonuclease|nr:YraN family protein [Prevotellaceae bacterium]
MASHNELGRRGEEIAQQYLLSKNYLIIDTNWKAGHYELDIVATKGDWLVVVEVKTRSTALFGRPEEFIDAAKMKRIGVATHHYVLAKQITSDIRFDIISIVMYANGKYKLEHLEDAFVPR